MGSARVQPAKGRRADRAHAQDGIALHAQQVHGQGRHLGFVLYNQNPPRVSADGQTCPDRGSQQSC